MHPDDTPRIRVGRFTPGQHPAPDNTGRLRAHPDGPDGPEAPEDESNAWAAVVTAVVLTLIVGGTFYWLVTDGSIAIARTVDGEVQLNALALTLTTFWLALVARGAFYIARNN